MENLAHITTMEIAIRICTYPNIKDIIFKRILRHTFLLKNYKEEEEEVCFLQWKKELEKATFIFLKNYPSELTKKICSFVLTIGSKLLKWAHYNYFIFGVPFDCTRRAVKRSIFNQQGTIKYLTALNELKIKTEFDNLKLFKMYYDFFYTSEKSTVPFNELSKKVKKEILTAVNVELLGEFFLAKQWLNFWKSEASWRRNILLTIEHSLVRGIYPRLRQLPMPNIKENKTKVSTFVLKAVAENYEREFLNSERIWIPEDFCMNLYLYFFEKFDDKGVVEIFKMSSAKYCYKILKGLLDWPFQVNFMKYAQLMWGILSFEDFVYIFLEIVNKNRGHEGRIYNYNLIFKQLWMESTENFKNFVCREKNTFYITLIIDKFLEIDPFTHFNRYNLKIIFEHFKKVTNSEMIFNLLKNIISKLTSNEKYKLADVFLECLLLPEHIADFKKQFILLFKAEIDSQDLLIEKKVNEVETLIKWCLLSKNSIQGPTAYILYLRILNKVITDLIRQGNSKMIRNILF